MWGKKRAWKWHAVEFLEVCCKVNSRLLTGADGNWTTNLAISRWPNSITNNMVSKKLLGPAAAGWFVFQLIHVALTTCYNRWLCSGTERAWGLSMCSAAHKRREEGDRETLENSFPTLSHIGNISLVFNTAVNDFAKTLSLLKKFLTSHCDVMS